MPQSKNKKNLNTSEKKTFDANNKFTDLKKIDKATETAFYYGFIPTKQPLVEQVDIECAYKASEEKNKQSNNEVLSPWETPTEEKISILRNYVEKNLIAEPQPIMLSYKNVTVSEKHNEKSSNEHFLNLQILGSSKSISEIVLIKSALAILADNNIKDTCVDINSIGDKESTNKFTRELTNYYRKNIEKMPADCRQIFKKDPFALLECDKKEFCRTLNEGAPKALSFLSEQSRQHFKEILEGFEILNINYRINNNLAPNRKYCSQTVFEIVRGADKNKEVLAYGSRYDGLAKKIGLKKDIPGVGLKISLKKLTGNTLSNQKIKKSDYFFIQLGFEAKLKSLNIIEMLRKAKISICQSLSRDMLGGQIALAEKLKMSYALIMGKKESMENTIMVRNMETRSQEIISNENLSDYLKKIKKS